MDKSMPVLLGIIMNANELTLRKAGTGNFVWGTFDPFCSTDRDPRALTKECSSAVLRSFAANRERLRALNDWAQGDTTFLSCSSLIHLYIRLMQLSSRSKGHHGACTASASVKV
jgi:hypothetical protein